MIRKWRADLLGGHLRQDESRSAEQRKGSYPYPFIAQDDDRPRGEVLGNLLEVGLDDG